MAEQPNKESQTQEPTQRRLEQARQDGDVAKSPEIAAFAALACASAVLLGAGGGLARSIADSLTPFIAHPEAIDLSGRGGAAVFRAALTALAPAALVMLAAAAGGAAGNLIQHGFLFTPKRLAPDFKKLNPFAGLKRLVGPDNLINFAKTFAKFTLTVVVVWLVLRGRMAALPALSALPPTAILPLAIDMLRAMLMAALLLLAPTAGLDWLVQRHRYMTRMRMSREQVKQEHKESEGDPQLKAKIKAMRTARSKKRIIQNVPKATLVIANPTHFAVALRYVQGETAAPVCVAKGVDSLALKIREVAQVHRIAVVEDPPLARALYAAVDIDETIPREHFQAVAKIVGFVMGAGRRRARPIPPARMAPL